jgi:predicted RNA polymerase sigma factor
MPDHGDRTQHLLRELAPQVLGVMIRRYRDFAACEDAVQEALVAASLQWRRTALRITRAAGSFR